MGAPATKFITKLFTVGGDAVKDIWVDKNKCLHCFSCLFSCALAHSRGSDLWDLIMESPAPKPRLFKARDSDGLFPLMCRHCENSPCLESCIAAAITRNAESGVLEIDENRCVGCGMCIMVCPFGAVGLDRERRVAYKCDSCAETELPACIRACPTGALFNGTGNKYSELKRRRYGLRLMGLNGGKNNEVRGYRQ